MTAPLENALNRAASARTLLLALDFDGTLSPHVDEPMDARMLPEARDALHRLAATAGTTVALVSGRSIRDLMLISEYDPQDGWYLAGSHGAEYLAPGAAGIEGTPTDAEAALRDELLAETQAIAAPYPGVWIEPKTFGVGVHVRRASPEDARRVHEQTDALFAARAPGWRRRAGIDLIEYSFRDAGKDVAIRWLRERLHPEVILFAGDDVTDEDGMAALDEKDIGVRVGPGETRAPFRVANPVEMSALLMDLADRRAGIHSTHA